MEYLSDRQIVSRASHIELQLALDEAIKRAKCDKKQPWKQALFLLHQKDQKAFSCIRIVELHVLLELCGETT
jgi:hypothetical protein